MEGEYRLGSRQIILHPGVAKSKKPRIFPFIPELEELLIRQLNKTRRTEAKRGMIIPWVFHRKGKRIVSYQKEWKSTMDAGKFVGKKVHDFRSTAAKRLLRYSFSPFEVCAMVGWESIGTLKYYAIVEAEDLQQKAARLYPKTALKLKISQKAKGFNKPK